MTEPILQVRNLVKRFGGVLATDHLDFDMWPGEIHAVGSPADIRHNAAVRAVYLGQEDDIHA